MRAGRARPPAVAGHDPPVGPVPPAAEREPRRLLRLQKRAPPALRDVGGEGLEPKRRVLHELVVPQAVQSVAQRRVEPAPPRPAVGGQLQLPERCDVLGVVRCQRPVAQGQVRVAEIAQVAHLPREEVAPLVQQPLQLVRLDRVRVLPDAEVVSVVPGPVHVERVRLVQGLAGGAVARLPQHAV